MQRVLGHITKTETLACTSILDFEHEWSQLCRNVELLCVRLHTGCGKPRALFAQILS